MNDTVLNKWLISVIVPVYNVRPFLNEALDSVVRQTYQNLEVIIIDDGSTDGSGEICDQYAATDSRIKVIHQENQGLSAARNVGLDNMTGQALVFLDSDDAFSPTMIEKMLATMQRENADMVVCRYALLYTKQRMKPIGHTRPLLKSGIYDHKTTLYSLVDQKLNISVWNKLYRTNLWRNIRFPVGKVYEDWAVVFPVLDQSNKMCVLSDTLYMHRIHPNSISMTPTLIKLNDWIDNYSEYEAFVKQRIPELFTVRQLKKIQEHNIYRMMEQYTKNASQNSNPDELKQFRKRIIEKARSVRLKSRSNWCIYQMLRICPGLLPIAYQIRKRIRNSAIQIVS